MELRAASYMSLATFRKSGAEVATPVWFAECCGVLYAFSSGEAGKVKRLRNSSRARVAPCDVRGKLLGDWQEATAVLLSEPADIERAHQALRRKYGWQMKLMDFFAGLSGRSRKRAWIAVSLGG